MFQFRRIVLGFFAAALLSNRALADDVVVKGVRVDGGSMSCLGLTLTYVDKNYTHTQYLKYVGWGLVIGGIVVSSGSTTNSTTEVVPAKSVWNSLRSESRLAAHHSSLIDGTSAIVAAASKSGISVAILAALTEKVDAVTAKARQLGQTLSVENVVAQVNAGATVQPIVANLAQIALIAQ